MNALALQSMAIAYLRLVKDSYEAQAQINEADKRIQKNNSEMKRYQKEFSQHIKENKLRSINILLPDTSLVRVECVEENVIEINHERIIVANGKLQIVGN